MSKPMCELVKRKDWQDLRISFLGTWKHTPVENVKKLREWIGDFKTTSMDKLRIVMNYLTGSGFRSGRIKHPEIQKLRDDISIEMKVRKGQLVDVRDKEENKESTC